MPSVPDRTEHRCFYLAPPWPEAGETVTLAADESRHAAVVMRLRTGNEVRLVDGEGQVATAAILRAGPKQVLLKLGTAGAAPEESASLGLIGVPYLRAPGRMDWAIEKATELGGAACEVYRGARSMARMAAKCARWSRVAKAAMKQSGRALWPPVRFHDSLAALLVAHPDVTLIVADPRGGVLEQLPRERMLLVGPEGGWTDQEEALLSERAALRVGLGPHRLRAETAVAALCVRVRDSLERSR